MSAFKPGVLALVIGGGHGGMPQCTCHQGKICTLVAPTISSAGLPAWEVSPLTCTKNHPGQITQKVNTSLLHPLPPSEDVRRFDATQLPDHMVEKRNRELAR
jgi:hypothetical protein